MRDEGRYYELANALEEAAKIARRRARHTDDVRHSVEALTDKIEKVEVALFYATLNEEANVETMAGKRKLSRNFTTQMRNKLDSNIEKMPPDWNGAHIRALYAEMFSREADMGIVKKAKREINRSMSRYELSI